VQWSCTEEEVAEIVAMAADRTVKAITKNIKQAAAIDIDRLDALLSAVWDDAMNGERLAIVQALNIIERRSKLLGMDHHSIFDAEGVSEEDLTRLSVDQLRQYAELQAQVRGIKR
jgi:predicted kinase